MSQNSFAPSVSISNRNLPAYVFKTQKKSKSSPSAINNFTTIFTVRMVGVSVSPSAATVHEPMFAARLLNHAQSLDQHPHDPVPPGCRQNPSLRRCLYRCDRCLKRRCAPELRCLADPPFEGIRCSRGRLSCGERPPESCALARRNGEPMFNSFPASYQMAARRTYLCSCCYRIIQFLFNHCSGISPVIPYGSPRTLSVVEITQISIGD